MSAHERSNRITSTARPVDDVHARALALGAEENPTTRRIQEDLQGTFGIDAVHQTMQIIGTNEIVVIWSLQHVAINDVMTDVHRDLSIVAGQDPIGDGNLVSVRYELY